MGLKRFDMVLAYFSVKIPGQTARRTLAGAEAGLLRFSGKQKVLKKTVAFVAHFPFSHRPERGCFLSLVAYPRWWCAEEALQCAGHGRSGVRDLSSPRSLSFSEK